MLSFLLAWDEKNAEEKTFEPVGKTLEEGQKNPGSVGDVCFVDKATHIEERKPQFEPNDKNSQTVIPVRSVAASSHNRRELLLGLYKQYYKRQILDYKRLLDEQTDELFDTKMALLMSCDD